MDQENSQELLCQVLGSVAAQVRTSMGNMSGILFKLSADPSKEMEMAILRQSFYRLLRLAENLSDAPLLAEDTPFPLQDTELVAWLKHLCQQVRPIALDLGITLTFRTALTSHIVAIHKRYLERLVWNLLSNALKFTPQGGRVDVELSIRGEQVILTVADNGCGISEERMETVYDRYLHPEQLDAAPYGLGLGLPLCRRIAQGHDGRLVIMSREGEGTQATVSLPDRRVGLGLEQMGFVYSGGFPPVLVELSDALPYRVYLPKHSDD